MSKYLHYGHISPVHVALRIWEASEGQENMDSYLKELIVRRVLSISFQIYKTPRAEIPHAANRQSSRSAP
jgi:deoxyribodipyrimidine photo-lyase